MAQDTLKLVGMVLLVIVVIGGGIYAISTFLQTREGYMDLTKEMARNMDVAKDKFQKQDVSQESAAEQAEDAVMIDEQERQEMAQADKLSSIPPKPVDLLPSSDEADAWARANPHGEGSLELRNFIEAGTHIGVDTQAATLRNANRQLRSEPPNPQQVVSPWVNSSIMPDTNRKALEIGGDF